METKNWYETDNVCNDLTIYDNDSMDTTNSSLSHSTPISRISPSDDSGGSLRIVSSSSLSSCSSQRRKEVSNTIGADILARPRLYVEEAFRSNGCSDLDSIVNSCKSRMKPVSEEMTQAYSAIVTAVRQDDTTLVRKLYCEESKGCAVLRKGVNACNRFGESILHIACRRGNIDMIRLLVTDLELKVEESCDDYGRTPLHDAFWAGFEPRALRTVDFLLKQPYVTELLLCEDFRGSTPLDYTRREDRELWLCFLSERKIDLCCTTTKATKTMAKTVWATLDPTTVSETSHISKRKRSESVIIENVNDEKNHVDFSFVSSSQNTVKRQCR